MPAATFGPADPALVHAWLKARSVARGLPAPVADHDGWRVDTDLPSEHCRYVFASPVDGLRDLARSIDRPAIVIKLCARRDALRRLLPRRFRVAPQSWMMTADAMVERSIAPPPGYRLRSVALAHVTTVTIVDAGGILAASGTAADHGGAFVYDRIVTHPEHRRRGLGTVVMMALGKARGESVSQQILVATEDGRALYRSLGWRDYAPYASASIPIVETAESHCPIGSDGLGLAS